MQSLEESPDGKGHMIAEKIDIDHSIIAMFPGFPHFFTEPPPAQDFKQSSHVEAGQFQGRSVFRAPDYGAMQLFAARRNVMRFFWSSK